MVEMASPVDADLLRLRHEFLSQRPLSLTAAQVARLLSLRLDHALEILSTLVQDGWLIRSPSGQYRLPHPTELGVDLTPRARPQAKGLELRSRAGRRGH